MIHEHVSVLSRGASSGRCLYAMVISSERVPEAPVEGKSSPIVWSFIQEKFTQDIQEFRSDASSGAQIRFPSRNRRTSVDAGPNFGHRERVARAWTKASARTRPTWGGPPNSPKLGQTYSPDLATDVRCARPKFAKFVPEAKSSPEFGRIRANPSTLARIRPKLGQLRLHAGRIRQMETEFRPALADFGNCGPTSSHPSHHSGPPAGTNIGHCSVKC